MTDHAELIERLRAAVSEFSGSEDELKAFRNLFVEQEDCALAIISKPGKVQLLSPPAAWFAACSAGLELARVLPALSALVAERDAQAAPDLKALGALHRALPDRVGVIHPDELRAAVAAMVSDIRARAALAQGGEK